MHKVTRYVNKTGKCPFIDFISDLKKNKKIKELTQIEIAIKLLEQYGFSLPQIKQDFLLRYGHDMGYSYLES